MRKYYYVCPRCGRCYKRFIPRRKAKCGFCSTVWKTRGAKGTRSAFSWTATLAVVLAIVALAFLAGRELGLISKSPDSAQERHYWGVASDPLTENAENVESASETEDAANVEVLEDDGLESVETAETTENEAE